jgi:hypothetical protein
VKFGRNYLCEIDVEKFGVNLRIDNFLMSQTPLQGVLDIVTLCNALETRVRRDVEKFKVVPPTPADYQLIASRLRKFEEVSQGLKIRKELPHFGTYTFQRIFSAIIATLEDLAELVSESVAVPPLKRIRPS